MRKLIVLALAMMMVLAMVPTVAMADSADYVVENQTFDGVAWVKPDPEASAGRNIVYKNCTFTSKAGSEGFGAYLEIDAMGQNVTIDSCTFEDRTDGAYSCMIKNAKDITIINNKINGSTRGFLIYPVEGTLTATGNIITLLAPPLPANNPENKLSGFQFANAGWRGASINIFGNEITNATGLIRLHSSFALADGDPGVISLGNNKLNGAAEVIIDSSASAEARARLEAIVEKIVHTSDTEVTANVDPTFTIVIPASVDLGTLQKDVAVTPQAFNVTAQNVIIEEGKQITVSVTSDYLLSSGTANLSYQLYSGDNLMNATNNVFATFTNPASGVDTQTQNGEIKVPDTSGISVAGVYQDTMTFTIAYQDK